MSDRRRPRLLDLFCGAGGAAVGYDRAGFEVVGVDIKVQLRYPFEFRRADAMSFSFDGFDAIHASPPCQNWTAYKRRPNHVRESEQLVIAVRERFAQECQGRPTVIENVADAPLLNAVMLCGSMFEPPLDVRRHRYFEVTIPDGGALRQEPCRHSAWEARYPSSTNRSNLRHTVEVGASRIRLDVQKTAMGIQWMSRRELTQAVPPAYTEWIGRRLID